MNLFSSLIISIFIFLNLDATSYLGMMTEGTYTVERYKIVIYKGMMYVDHNDFPFLCGNDNIAIVKFFEDDRDFIVNLGSWNQPETSNEFIALLETTDRFYISEIPTGVCYYQSELPTYDNPYPQVEKHFDCDYLLGDTKFKIDDPSMAQWVVRFGIVVHEREFAK